MKEFLSNLDRDVFVKLQKDNLFIFGKYLYINIEPGMLKSKCKSYYTSFDQGRHFFMS